MSTNELTPLQEDLIKLGKEYPAGSWQARTAHNALVKLQCFNPVVAMYDAIGEYIEVAEVIDDEQALIHKEEEA